MPCKICFNSKRRLSIPNAPTLLHPHPRLHQPSIRPRKCKMSNSADITAEQNGAVTNAAHYRCKKHKRPSAPAKLKSVLVQACRWEGAPIKYRFFSFDECRGHNAENSPHRTTNTIWWNKRQKQNKKSRQLSTEAPSWMDNNHFNN